jgi:acyl-CoA thioester hydrolase
MSVSLFVIDLPVRWSDLDAFDHVNNARFLSYVEEARLAWFDGLAAPWMDAAVAPLLASIQMDYRRPITWPATVRVELRTQRIGNSSLTLGHRIVDAAAPDRLYGEGHAVMVWIDRASGRPVPLPAGIRAAAGTPGG